MHKAQPPIRFNRFSDLLARLPAWRLHAVLGLVGGFALLLAFALLPDLHEFDLRLAGWLRLGEAPSLDRRIMLVDVPQQREIAADQIIPDFRRRLGVLLTHLAADTENLPERVALDVWFDGKIGGQAPVLAGIEALNRARVPVHGALNLLEKEEDHQFDIYGRMESVGHTQFVAAPTEPFYHPCLADGRMAMALQLGGQTRVCDDKLPSPRHVHLGLPLEQGGREHLLGFDPACASRFRRYGGDCLPAPPPLRGAILIIGQLREDRSPYPQRSGPEMVAWATNDLIGPSGVARTVLVSPALHLGLVLAMPLLALGIFVALLRFVRQWRLKPLRIAALAALLTLLAPLALVLVMRAAGRDYSQVLLPTLLTLLLLGIAAHYRSSAAREEAKQRQAQQLHEHVAYDVFISYRRTHADWVAHNLLPIIRDLRRADGAALNVFWDNQKLHSGNYNRQLEIAIHESRLFLPLLTPDYFDQEKKYCYWEMSTAWDRVPSGRIAIFPLLHDGYDPNRHGHRDFPTLNTAMHGVSSSDPDFNEKLCREILAALV